MKKYIKPEMSIEAINVEDVVTSSAGLTVMPDAGVSSGGTVITGKESDVDDGIFGW